MSLHNDPYGSKHDREGVDYRSVRGLSLPSIVGNRSTVKHQLPSLREALRIPSAIEHGSLIKESCTEYRTMGSVLSDAVEFYSDLC